MMQKNKAIVLKVEVKHSIISWAQFPNAVINMFCDVIRKLSAVLRKQFDVHSDLFELNTCILIGFTFLTKFFHEVTYIRLTIGSLIKINRKHCFTSQMIYSYMIA